MMKALKKKRKGGFTLIELIVVIAILGILAAIAIPRFADVSANSRIGAAEANHRTLTSAVLMAQTQNGGALPATGLTSLDNFIQGGTASMTESASTWTVDATSGVGTLVTTVAGTSTAYPAGTDGNIVTSISGTNTVFTTTFTP